MDTRIPGDDKACEIKLASTPLSSSEACAKDEEGDQRQRFEAGQELRHQKDCPMLT
jgi:hypothetical protein